MSRPELLAHASQAMAVGSKSFASAVRLFAPPTRHSALLLYAWCRHCDDVIDGQQLGFNAAPNAAVGGEQRLALLREQTARAYAGDSLAEPAFAAFQQVALQHAIPQEWAFDHLEGFAMDVRDEQYETLGDTLRYCYHVAGVVGLMMARVMGVQDAAALDRACDLGLAFQLTNIARDIVEDSVAGRCYLPGRWLADAGLTREGLAAPAARIAVAGLAERLVAAAEPYYRSARAGLPALPLRSAWAIATARGVYREIGVKVRNAGAQAWDQRQGTNKAEKLYLLLRGGGVALMSRRPPAAPRPAGLWQRPGRGCSGATGA